MTGGTGFLGNHLLERLKKLKFEYTVFDKNKHDLFKPQTLKNAISKKDCIIHLAALHRDQNQNNILHVNVEGTRGVLEAMRLFNPDAKLIFTSSFQVYVKNNLYGLSKRNAEILIEKYVKKYAFKSVILRMTNLYGPGYKPFHNSALCTFIHQVKNKQVITINGDGSQTRDYLYVDDAVDAIMSSLNYEPRTISYFDLCTGKKTSLNDIINLLRSINKDDILVKYNRAVDMDDWGIKKNYKKAAQILGWKPKTNLSDGLKLMFSSF